MINAQIRKNAEHKKAVEEAERYGNEYAELTGQLERLRADRRTLLDGADLPLPGSLSKMASSFIRVSLGMA